MTIRRGLLSDYFSGVVAKKLTLVETVTPQSNQHEFQGTRAVRAMLGDEDRRAIPTKFLWLGDEQEGLTEEGFVSWSNVRKGKPRAPEYHLYYSGNPVTEMMRPSDMMFLAQRPDGSVMVILTPEGGTVHNQLSWLFAIDQASEQFTTGNVETDKTISMDFAARYVMDELGLEMEEPEADQLDTLIEKFGLKFPTTREFSDLARASLPHVSALDAPDEALLEWINREEQLFRRLERVIVAERLQSGFMATDGADVDGFLSFSLSVQNRRKSRAGSALENHLEVMFQAHGIQFDRGAETENRNKPDFLFPGQAEYHNPAFPAARLTMLGSKSTLKDRWRQVLSEAERIDEKHLLTLEPGVSENQTDEMRAKRLQLVLPSRLHATYKPAQQEWLMDVAAFIAAVKTRQNI